jgi:hypothetical protein
MDCVWDKEDLKPELPSGRDPLGELAGFLRWLLVTGVVTRGAKTLLGVRRKRSSPVDLTLELPAEDGLEPFGHRYEGT